MDFKLKTDKLDGLLDSARQKRAPMGMEIDFECPALIELAVSHGTSWILVDMEHTELQFSRILEVLRTADATGVPWFVKLPKWDPIMARDVLDFGAYGIVVGFVERAEQLRDMLADIRFPPDGRRGWCSIARSAEYATIHVTGQKQVRSDFFKFSNEKAILIPTIETVEGANNVDELMKVEGCPIWHIGPDDLGLALLGWDAPLDDDYAREVGKVILALERRMHAAGKLLMMHFLTTPGLRERTLETNLGFYNVDLPYTVDAGCYSFGLMEARAIMEEFRNRNR